MTTKPAKSSKSATKTAAVTKPETVLILRSCTPDMKGSENYPFPYPKTGPVVAPKKWDKAWGAEPDAWRGGFVNDKRCGGGLHGLLYGVGDWGLTRVQHHDSKWLVIEAVKDTVVDLGSKVKYPGGEVIYSGSLGVALTMVTAGLMKHVREIVGKGTPGTIATTGDSAHAATTGNSAHAATTGDSAHAATTGNSAHAATTGNSAHAATTGNSAHAATTGDSAHAATTGNSAHAATTGYYAHAATTGDYAHAATTGDSAHAATTGDSAHAATTGNSAHAATTGNSAHAATTGNYAHAATTGDYAHAATTGDSAHAATTGDSAHAATTGNSAHAATTGNSAHAATTGNYAHAATTGDYAHAATTGDSAHAATTGEKAIACALGLRVKVKAGKDGAVIVGWWDSKNERPRVTVGYVGEGIEAGVWYQADDGGKLVKAADQGDVL